MAPDAPRNDGVPAGTVTHDTVESFELDPDWDYGDDVEWQAWAEKLMEGLGVPFNKKTQAQALFVKKLSRSMDPSTLWVEYAVEVDDLDPENLARVAQLQCCLADTGLTIQRTYREENEVMYMLIGANQDLLESHAERMELDVPLMEAVAGESSFRRAKKELFRPFTSTLRQRIILNLIEADRDLGGAEISQESDGVIAAFFPLQDNKEQAALVEGWVKRKPWRRQPLNVIRDYFGEETAFYFTFLGFYTAWLVPAALAGLVAFIISRAVDDKGWTNSVYSVIIAVWAAVMLEYWKISCVIIATISLLSFRIWVQKQLFEKEGSKGFMAGGYIGSIANAITIIILNQVYRFVAVKLTNWENHRTEQDYDSHLITKIFMFTFVNSFTGLFYMAYIKSGAVLFGDHQLEDFCAGQATVRSNAR
eukprot:m51a1_g824 hypothetical protein (421) ;mRNA; r:707986-710372